MARAMPRAWQLPSTAMLGPSRVVAARARFRHGVAQVGAQLGVERVNALRARRGRSFRATSRAGVSGRNSAPEGLSPS
ncbi:hypothetical protein MRA01_30020 [Methylobacterium radiotolerans]|nr:hypothetical protein MRA01_30020 [Methylobacterium radiotolerans]